MHHGASSEDVGNKEREGLMIFNIVFAIILFIMDYNMYKNEHHFMSLLMGLSCIIVIHKLTTGF